MKKELLALSLLAGFGLFADGSTTNTQPPQQGDGCCAPAPTCCNTCCSTPCCCKPCCVPKPKKCIDCECYAPAFYDLQCDWGVSVDVEFLYWYAGETNLSYALKLNSKEIVPGSVTSAFSPSGYKYVKTSWDPGFRIGLGYNSDCDGWDSYITWTWMKNSSNSSTSVADFVDPLDAATYGLINPWINQSFNQNLLGADFAATTASQLFDRVSGKWRLTYNQIDWELGRKYWNSSCFALRPYIALRGAWWKTRFNTNSQRTLPEVTVGSVATTDGYYTQFKDKFTNDVWGVGFLGGLQPTWYFCCNFAIYGNFDVALIWGSFDAKKRESYFVQDTTTGELVVDYCNRASGCFSQMTPMLDTAIGLRWEETWCCDQYRTALDLGWEHHVLFDQNHRMKTIDTLGIDANTDDVPEVAGFRTYAEATGNIGMGGLVLRLRFDF